MATDSADALAAPSIAEQIQHIDEEMAHLEQIEHSAQAIANAQLRLSQRYRLWAWSSYTQHTEDVENYEKIAHTAQKKLEELKMRRKALINRLEAE